jgi:predicted small secreted protein
MNENKTTTYGDLKCRKAELRTEMETGDYSNCDEYIKTVQAIRNTELTLLYNITPDESCGELPKSYKRVKYVVIAISIAVILSIVLFGCHTISGFGGDLKAWSSPYIEHQN